MVDNKLRYGLLSTYNENRFFFARSRNEIEVSDAVMARDATSTARGVVSLRRAFAYWLSLCNGPDSQLPSDRMFVKRLTNEWQKETHLADGSEEPSLPQVRASDGNVFLQASNGSDIAPALHSSLLASKFVDWNEFHYREPWRGPMWDCCPGPVARPTNRLEIV